MKPLVVLVLVLAGAVAAEAFLYNDADWSDLKVTWGANPFNSQYFQSIPRKESDAKAADWTAFSRGNECNGAFYNGYRFIKNNDPAVMLLFDKNGYIAGIQMGAQKDKLPAGTPSRYIQALWNDDDDMYVITAYFVDPAIVCTTGRTEEEFDQHGTGTDLYIQNGTTPAMHIKIPKSESGLTDTAWTKGGCFYTMGRHYWYNVSRDMDCDRFFPVFLMYNSGDLNGFGWNMNANLDSHRYEHPPAAALGLFFEEAPTCLPDLANRGLTTQHIYLDSTPQLNFC
ncbi:uncharacterized protein LOC144868873 [Branchiostoma floridae x Branchiostoma japonicum]|uniref:Uncharacterized protein n=1 Tax=Branchiostoma floridae TaxID=7739 RepID=C3Y5U1_BRAFL|eukprot:XP_002608328.1 hypothetical protein BRAFLDRAFT_125500 [Branchiostoma floridae]